MHLTTELQNKWWKTWQNYSDKKKNTSLNQINTLILTIHRTGYIPSENIENISKGRLATFWYCEEIKYVIHGFTQSGSKEQRWDYSENICGGFSSLKVYTPHNIYVRPTKCFWEFFIIRSTASLEWKRKRQEEMKECC